MGMQCQTIYAFLVDQVKLTSVFKVRYASPHLGYEHFFIFNTLCTMQCQRIHDFLNDQVYDTHECLAGQARIITIGLRILLFSTHCARCSVKGYMISSMTKYMTPTSVLQVRRASSQLGYEYFYFQHIVHDAVSKDT